MVIGYLAPNGEFTTCNMFGHLDCAAAICRKMGKEFYNRYLCEEYLLDIGYIAFRKYDVLTHMVKGTGEPNVLTDEQVDFINEHQNDWNNLSQMDSVAEMLGKRGICVRGVNNPKI